MNKKTIIFIIVLIGLVILAIFIYHHFFNTNSNQNNNYNGSKLNSNNAVNYNTSYNEYNNNSNSINNESITNNIEVQPPISKEEEISTFTTKIYTKDPERQNNISITCSTLNDTIVSKGSTFSFCDTVGKSTSSKGYQKADVFKNGDVIQALGGGNCQVSTTLYNAVLNIPTLSIEERHSHSNSVPYIESGKDAAVAYGSYDFKFVNNSDFDIKIKAENNENEVFIKLMRIK